MSLDDIIVFGWTFHQHLTQLGEVLTKLRQAILKVRPAKCNLFSAQVHYLRHIISASGVEADPTKVEAVRQWMTPKNQTEEFCWASLILQEVCERFWRDCSPHHQLWYTV